MRRFTVPALVATLVSGCGGRPTTPRSAVLVTIAGLPSGVSIALDELELRTATVASTDILASEASLQTGVLPTRHGLRGARPGEKLSADVRTLAEVARAAGLRTAAFVASPALQRSSGIDRGFDSWTDAGHAMVPRSPEVVVAEVVDALASAGQDGRSFYYWVQLDPSDDTLDLGMDGIRTALTQIREQVAKLGADSVAVAIAGSLGEHRGASLATADAQRVAVAWPRMKAQPTPACADSLLSTARRLALAAGLGGIPCDAVTGSESFALARRFGLPAIATRAPDPPTTFSLPPDLTAELVQLALPEPQAQGNDVRAGATDATAVAAAILDQEVGKRRLSAGHPTSARALYERALALDPLALEALVEISRLDVLERRFEAASTRLGAALPSYTGRPEIYHALSHVRFLLGDFRVALACARVAFAMAPDDAEIAFDIAADLAALGRGDDAFAALERAIDLGFHDAVLLANLPTFTPFHADPRYAAVLTRLRTGA